MKDFQITFLWSHIMQDAIHQRAVSFWIDFLHNDEICS